MERTALKTIDIEVLPSGLIDEPWDGMLQSLQRDFPFIEASKLLNLGWAVVESHWLNATHWLYKKKYNHGHRIPFRDKNLSEEHGEVYLAYFNLCIEVHAMHPHGKNYRNSAEWFKAISLETKRYQLAQALNREGKYQRIKSIRQIADCYKCFENPHDPESMPHLWRLVDACLTINARGKSPALIAKYWRGTKPKSGDRFHNRGLIDAITKLATAVDRNPKMGMLMFEEDGLYIQLGQGKHRTKVSNESIDHIIANSVHLKPIDSKAFGF
jgi:hypothetical protein